MLRSKIVHALAHRNPKNKTRESLGGLLGVRKVASNILGLKLMYKNSSEVSQHLYGGNGHPCWSGQAMCSLRKGRDTGTDTARQSTVPQAGGTSFFVASTNVVSEYLCKTCDSKNRSLQARQKEAQPPAARTRSRKVEQQQTAAGQQQRKRKQPEAVSLKTEHFIAPGAPQKRKHATTDTPTRQPQAPAPQQQHLPAPPATTTHAATTSRASDVTTALQVRWVLFIPLGELW